jgi:hypothetical protein
MRPMTALMMLMLFAGVARAQERVEADEAEKVAKMLTEKAKDLPDPQVKTNVDATKPYGVHEGKYAVLIVPDKSLTSEALAKAGDAVVPVGQLWTRALSPVVGNEPAASGKLRLVTISPNGEDEKVSVLLLGARKKAEGEWELLVFGKDKEPLLRLPIEKADATQEMPIDLEGKRNDNGTGDVTLHILRKYKTSLTVAPQEL